MRRVLNGPTMGTRFAVVFYGRLGRPTLAADLQAAADRVDRQMSTWKPDSDLCRFNAAPVGKWVRAPAELLLVIEAAFAVAIASGGAFDIGVGASVDAWGFGPAGHTPDPSRIAALERVAPAHEAIALDRTAGRMRKETAVSLDLGGIAKGYGVDALAGVLDGHGISDYLVSIDGELRSRGRKPGGAPWTVAVERPEPSARSTAGVLEVNDVAVATSGRYRHRRHWKGGEVSHTINPRSGFPVVNRLASVTVVHGECLLADAWATALTVLGERDGPRFATEKGMDALFLVEEGNGFAEIGAGGFA